MPGSSHGAPDAGPLSSADREALARANERARGILGAARVASFHGWSFAGLAVLTLLLGFASPSAWVVGLGLALVARNELRGRTLLRRLDPAGPRLLGRNQLGLLALIVVYCGWSMVRALTHPSPELRQLEEILGPDTGQLVTDLSLLVYAVVIVVSIIYQGLTARYYYARGPRLAEHLRETPAWILDLQRSDTMAGGPS